MQDYLKFQIGTALVKDGVCKLPYASIIEALTPAYFPENYRFGGVAHPNVSPAKIFGPTMYVAVDVGVYKGFSSHSVGMNEVALFTSSDGDKWEKWVVVSDCCDEINYPTPPTPGPLSTPFTIEATADGTTVYFRQSSFAAEGGVDPLKVEVSTDDGASWQEVTAALATETAQGAVLATLDAGEKVLIRGRNAAYGYYYEGYGAPVDNCNFWADQPCYVSGNIMSLVGGEDFAGVLEVQPYAFSCLFSDYDNALNWSWVLSREGDPLLLPATTLAESCYDTMFRGCRELTEAPALPATTLAKGCYANMFTNCFGLTEAPALPATTLAESCYDTMFRGCRELTSVVCLATDISATDATYSWLFNVSASGTFTKAAGVAWPSGADGIPDSWTVVEA